MASKLLISILILGAVGFSFQKPSGKFPEIRDKTSPKWQNRGQVVFLGDSITDWWRNDGKVTWDQFYEILGAVNTGVAGDRTTTIIDRINNQGIIDNLNAYLAVLKIGTNDLSGNVPVDTVAYNIAIITNLIQLKNPGIKLLVLGILPRGGSEIHSRIRQVNSIIKNYADNQQIFYLDMDEQFSSDLGQVIPSLYWDDQLHLSSAGYVKWAETMNPIFNEILNSPFPAKAVWLGDSLTAQWGSTGLPVWNANYRSIESLNVAVSGHTSQQTINRIEQEGVLDGLNSKIAVLMIGGNDLAMGAQAPQVIANIQRILSLIREKLPHGRILLLGLLPSGGHPDSVVEQGKLVNSGLAEFDNKDDVIYLEMTYEFADENENIHEELFVGDRTHLSLLGYELWQRTMAPTFNNLLQF